MKNFKKEEPKKFCDEDIYSIIDKLIRGQADVIKVNKTLIELKKGSDYSQTILQNQYNYQLKERIKSLKKEIAKEEPIERETKSQPKLISDYEKEILQLAECYEELSTQDRIKEIAEETGYTFAKIDSLVKREYQKLKKLEEQKTKEEEEKVEVPKKSYIFSRRGQIEDFWEEQPFFYDKSKIFWLWDDELRKWCLSDEIDFLNCIQKKLGIETIAYKSKVELVEGFKQIGRMHQPKPFKKTWIQYKDKIYDVMTLKSFDATPEYFATNPIPWKVGNSKDTPTIDKLFTEWVGEINKQKLYELTAYNTSLNKFMQRLFGLIGGGSNGKGTFIKLQYKFLGKENCVSSEIKSLSEDKFEPAILYRKLLCVMGEVSSDDLKNTNQLKKLGGEDLMSFQFKGKTPFTDENTATCACLSNSLPTTPDKSIGFYRKWNLIDFPNQFKGIVEDLIDNIPDVEFENLALKSLNTLKEIYEKKKFFDEGTFEERMQRYEERSNPVLRFVEEFCVEEDGSNISLREFTNSCNDYLKSKHLRILTAKQIGKGLREEGFSVSPRKIEGVSAIVILNLSLLLSKLSKLSKSKLNPYIETNRKESSFDSNNSNSEENNDTNDAFSEKEINCFACQKKLESDRFQLNGNCYCEEHYNQVKGALE